MIHSIFNAWHYEVQRICTLTRLLWYACSYVCLILYIIVHSINLKSNFQMHVFHQQKTFPSGRNGCVRVDVLRQSHQRHPGGGLLLSQRGYYASGCILPSDRCFAVSSRSVSLLLYTNTLALRPTVTIHRNGFIGYTLASGLPLRKSLLTFFLH